MTSPYGTNSPRDAAPAIAALAAAALLLAAAPADAGLVKNSITAGGVGAVGLYFKNLHEKIRGADDKMFGAFLDGDDDKVLAESRKLDTIHVSPVLDPVRSVKDMAASAKRKFVKRVDDVRAALAFDRDERKEGGIGARILGGPPPQALKAKAFVAEPSPPPAEQAGTPGGWGNPGSGGSQSVTKWLAAKQAARPDCYGVVDVAKMPADCPNREGAAKAASKGGAWSEWESSPKHVSDVDRESAQVSAFALRCWGVSGVNEYHTFYPIMKKRMQADDCLKEEAEGKLRDSSKKEYAAALADALGEDAAAEGGGDYRDALTSLEAREAERRRLEAEERARLARLEEERERQARLAERRKAEERERRRQERLAEQRRNEEEDREYRRLNALEAQQQAEQRRQFQQNVYESTRAFSEQLRRTYGYGGGRSSGGGSSSDEEWQCPDGSFYSYVQSSCVIPDRNR